jgi:hypothetical protein
MRFVISSFVYTLLSTQPWRPRSFEAARHQPRPSTQACASGRRVRQSRGFHFCHRAYFADYGGLAIRARERPRALRVHFNGARTLIVVTPATEARSAGPGGALTSAAITVTVGG